MLKVLLVGVLMLVVAGCAPGSARYNVTAGRPANFWAGFWHGLIIIITFIVSLFTSDVRIYESNNVGWAYNLGFILGASVSLGTGWRGVIHRRRHRHDRDWEKVGGQIGESVKASLSSWRKEERAAESDHDWDELGRKIEERIREELKKARD
ncbi:MAG TPA: hypothetical protein VMH22_08615 [bacterium]|nr:hypothetical protein [bacterium]